MSSHSFRDFAPPRILSNGPAWFSSGEIYLVIKTLRVKICEWLAVAPAQGLLKAPTFSLMRRLDRSKRESLA